MTTQYSLVNNDDKDKKKEDDKSHLHSSSRLVSNQSVSALVYNGSLLGPTLHIKPGERMVVNYVNKLDQPITYTFTGFMCHHQAAQTMSFV
jgi:FtsP/CotA-like multicopper oxidase with cupredoxin domain